MRIYVVEQSYGCYSDYTEQVVGVTDKWDQAIQFAKQFKDEFNADLDNGEVRCIDDNQVRICQYESGKYLLHFSKAEQEAYGVGDNSKIIYELDNQGRLVDVEVEK
jgi:hypothetical protein